MIHLWYELECQLCPRPHHPTSHTQLSTCVQPNCVSFECLDIFLSIIFDLFYRSSMQIFSNSKLSVDQIISGQQFSSHDTEFQLDFSLGFDSTFFKLVLCSFCPGLWIIDFLVTLAPNFWLKRCSSRIWLYLAPSMLQLMVEIFLGLSDKKKQNKNKTTTKSLMLQPTYLMVGIMSVRLECFAFRPNGSKHFSQRFQILSHNFKQIPSVQTPF